MMFRLIGQTTKFNATRFFTNAAGIFCVHGITLDGKRQTVARFVDVEPVA